MGSGFGVTFTAVVGLHASTHQAGASDQIDAIKLNKEQLSVWWFGAD